MLIFFYGWCFKVYIYFYILILQFNNFYHYFKLYVNYLCCNAPLNSHSDQIYGAEINKFCIIIITSILTRATVVRARFLAAAFSDGSYLAHVNGAYLRHVTFCIVRGPPLFIISPISQRVPSMAAAHFNSARLVQSPRRRRWRGWTNVPWNTCVPYFSQRVPSMAAAHFNSARLVQSPRRRRWRGWTNVPWNTCVPYFSIM